MKKEVRLLGCIIASEPLLMGVHYFFKISITFEVDPRET